MAVCCIVCVLLCDAVLCSVVVCCIAWRSVVLCVLCGSFAIPSEIMRYRSYPESLVNQNEIPIELLC